MPALLAILTLREGADEILSRRPNFSIGRVHGIKQQPVLVASLKHQRLTTQDGEAVPLWSGQTNHHTSQANSAAVIYIFRDTQKQHELTQKQVYKGQPTLTHLPYRGHL